MTLTHRIKPTKNRGLNSSKRVTDPLKVENNLEKERPKIKVVRDPFELALTGKKLGKTTVAEFERESEEEQRKLYD